MPLSAGIGNHAYQANKPHTLFGKESLAEALPRRFWTFLKGRA